MTDALPPLILRYEGEGAFSPATPYMAKLGDQHYCIGETYRVAEFHDRSQKTHNHFFASLSDIWGTLHETLAEEYPTTEHLRKKALIRTGYRDERSIVCASKAEAQRVAAFVRPCDNYAIVVVSEAVVRIYTAQSQSIRAMGKAEFQQSKQAVLDFAERLLRAPARKVA